MKELPEPSVYANINSYDVKLENVHFSYTGEEKDEVLHGIDLTMPAGSFTALVGPSGGGKSTVARLISRFWDVTSGSITIGGVNIREIPLSQLSEMISFVTQDNFLFRCSILEIYVSAIRLHRMKRCGKRQKGMLPGVYREAAAGL